MKHLTLRQSVGVLEDLGSDEDGISFRGEMTTPNDLLDKLYEEVSSSRQVQDMTNIATEDISIGYSTSDGTFVVGTFAGMIQDRMGS